MRYLTTAEVIKIHTEIVKHTTGLKGIRNHDLLVSALHRPKSTEYYKNADIFTIAAIYCVAIIKNHPFYDVNKRAISWLI